MQLIINDASVRVQAQSNGLMIIPIDACFVSVNDIEVKITKEKLACESRATNQSSSKSVATKYNNVYICNGHVLPITQKINNITLNNTYFITSQSLFDTNLTAMCDNSNFIISNDTNDYKKYALKKNNCNYKVVCVDSRTTFNSCFINNLRLENYSKNDFNSDSKVILTMDGSFISNFTHTGTCVGSCFVGGCHFDNIRTIILELFLFNTTTCKLLHVNKRKTTIIGSYGVNKIIYIPDSLFGSNWNNKKLCDLIIL